MAMKDDAFLKGVAAAKLAIPFEKAMKEKCPYQSTALRSAFIDGWRSVLDPEAPNDST